MPRRQFVAKEQSIVIGVAQARVLGNTDHLAGATDLIPCHAIDGGVHHGASEVETARPVVASLSGGVTGEVTAVQVTPQTTDICAGNVASFSRGHRLSAVREARAIARACERRFKERLRGYSSDIA